MKRTLVLAALCLSASALAESVVDPFVGASADAGASKAAVCAACHGPGGNSSNPEWPKLAGQHSRFVVAQLQRLKSGARANPIMMGQAAALSDQDMKDVAAYFAAQAPTAGIASPDALKVADPLYRKGDASRGLAACSSCHGPTGGGNAGAGYPRIGGQHATYVAKILRDYRMSKGGPANTATMAAVASKLSDAEIDALSSYVNGLQ